MSYDIENVLATTFSEVRDLRRAQLKHPAPRYARRLSCRLAILFYVMGPMFRVLSNRWCVFQDSPDWVVHAFAATTRRKGTAELSEAGQKLVAEAADEWQLRKRKRQQARRASGSSD